MNWRLGSPRSWQEYLRELLTTPQPKSENHVDEIEPAPTKDDPRIAKVEDYQLNGWICPACYRSNSPFVGQCSCPGMIQIETSSGATIPSTPYPFRG